jgi:hypothetical protein
MANTTIPSELIAADAITGAKIADNAVDSEHYTDGSIDTAHIADDQVTLAKMAGLARGKIIVGDSSGNPAALAIGTSGYVLKSDGTDIAWAADADTAALTTEQVQDIAGAMFSSNTETGITATYQDADGTIDLVVGTLNQNTTGSAATLTTARTIGGTSFDGSANIAVGLAATATTLATARTIGGVSFNGSANIDLPGVNTAGNQNVDAALVDGENFKINGGQGTDGQLMTSTGSGVAWEDAPAGGPLFKTFGDSSFQVGHATTGTIDAADYNTGVGVLALNGITTGDSNTAIGRATLYVLTSGSENTAVGMNSAANVTGSNNVAIGGSALRSVSSGSSASNNTAVGKSSMVANTTGTENVAVGTDAMGSNTEGEDNVAAGVGALYANTTGDFSVGVGHNALRYNTTGGNNVGVGRQALYSCTSGSELVGIGPQSLYTATTAVSCIAIGDRAMYTLLDSPYNVAIGYKSGFAFETGASNEGSCTFVGDSTGRSVTSGKQNTFIGATAGYATTATTTGYRNTMVGVGAHGAAAGGNLEVVLGFGCKGVGNGYTTIGSDTNRTYNQQGSTSWSAASDQRLKTDVVDEPIGLAFVNDLRPVKFKWKKKKDVDSSTFPDIYEEGSDERVQPSEHGVDKHGFLAQELEATIANYSDMGDAGHEIFKQTSDGMYNAAPTALIPMLVKALQEADDKIDALVARVTTLEG